MFKSNIKIVSFSKYDLSIFVKKLFLGIRYYKNSTLLYTSTEAAVGPLYVDTSFNTTASQLNEVYLFSTGEYELSAPFVVNTAGTVPLIGINPVTDDDIIDNTEDNASVYVTGTASNVIDGAVVTLSANGNTYTGNINQGAWTLSLPASDVQSLLATTTLIAQTLVDGNSITASRTVTHDVTLPAILLTSNNITDPSAIIPVSILFREAVTDLEISDFVVQGGSLTNLTTSNGGQVGPTYTNRLPPQVPVPPPIPASLVFSESKAL